MTQGGVKLDGEPVTGEALDLLEAEPRRRGAPGRQAPLRRLQRLRELRTRTRYMLRPSGPRGLPGACRWIYLLVAP